MSPGTGAPPVRDPVAVVGALRVRVPLRRPLVTARGTWYAAESWLLRVADDRGGTGLGEATLGPFPDPTDEAALADLVRDLVAGRVAADGVAGSDEELAAEPSPAMSAVRAAIGGARLDLGIIPTGARPRAERVPVNAMIGAESLHASVGAARTAAAEGFLTLKLKGGGEASSRELQARLSAVREAVGPRVTLRLDVNGAWDPVTARERLLALDRVGLQYVEQPLPAATGVEAVATAMAALRHGGTGVPIAADESVTSVRAARVLLDAGAVDALIVKPARVGGPGPALRIADLAHAAGVRVVISTLLETGVGLTACALTAAMLRPDPDAEAAHGIATGGLLGHPLVRDRARIRTGMLDVPPEGARIDLDRDAAEHFATERLGVWP
jgi:o-succinylbenzoate synthase